MKRIKEMKKNQKGFTLVELIVVLVILAILAAMLVPALLGYIDRARQGKYSEEMHSIYTAFQVVNDERYAKGANPIAAGALDGTNALTTAELAEINSMISPTSIDGAKVTATLTYAYADTTGHGSYSLNEIKNVTFTSQDSKTVTASIDGGSVVISKIMNGDTQEYPVPSTTTP